MNLGQLLANALQSLKSPPKGQETLPNDFWVQADLNDAKLSEWRKSQAPAPQQPAGRGWDVAPVGEVLGATTQDNPTSFDALLEMATGKARAAGFHPASIASQMAVESARGTSRFAKERNNYFGIGSFDNDLDNTWRFDSPDASVDAYIKTISNDPRYKDAYEKRQNPLEYIQAVKAAGYATDPNYVQTVTNTPEWRKYNQ